MYRISRDVEEILGSSWFPGGIYHKEKEKATSTLTHLHD